MLTFKYLDVLKTASAVSAARIGGPGICSLSDSAVIVAGIVIVVRSVCLNYRKTAGCDIRHDHGVSGAGGSDMCSHSCRADVTLYFGSRQISSFHTGAADCLKTARIRVGIAAINLRLDIAGEAETLDRSQLYGSAVDYRRTFTITVAFICGVISAVTAMTGCAGLSVICEIISQRIVERYAPDDDLSGRICAAGIIIRAVISGISAAGRITAGSTGSCAEGKFLRIGAVEAVNPDVRSVSCIAAADIKIASQHISEIIAVSVPDQLPELGRSAVPVILPYICLARRAAAADIEKLS